MRYWTYYLKMFGNLLLFQITLFILVFFSPDQDTHRQTDESSFLFRRNSENLEEVSERWRHCPGKFLRNVVRSKIEERRSSEKRGVDSKGSHRFSRDVRAAFLRRTSRRLDIWLGDWSSFELGSTVDRFFDRRKEKSWWGRSGDWDDVLNQILSRWINLFRNF